MNLCTENQPDPSGIRQVIRQGILGRNKNILKWLWVYIRFQMGILMSTAHSHLYFYICMCGQARGFERSKSHPKPLRTGGEMDKKPARQKHAVMRNKKIGRA